MHACRSTLEDPTTTVLALTAAAMFDPAAFPDPMTFDPTRVARKERYMNWGFGFHECFGRYINTVTIPELVAAVLRLEGVRREESLAGRSVGVKTLGFPDNFVVAFDPKRKGSDDGPDERAARAGAAPGRAASHG